VKSRFIDPTVTPPGGWRYIQPETGLEFRDSTRRLLARKVAEHREANGIEVGDVVGDIDDFVCANLPVGCDNCEPIYPNEDIALKQKFNIDDVRRFIESALAALGNRGLVGQATADARAKICSTCPLNQDVSGCWWCRGLAEKLFTLIGARTTVHAARLKQCGVCGCSLKAKIWLPQDVAQKVSEGYKFPSWCWLNAPSTGIEPVSQP
jgi:hypothetical protein